MTKQEELEQAKKKLMHEMLSHLSTWKEAGVTEAEQILSANNQVIKRMQAVDEQLTNEELYAYNKKYQKDWTTIIDKQEALTQWIRSEKTKIGEQLAQTGNKKKVVSSYIGLQKESGLIGKNY